MTVPRIWVFILRMIVNNLSFQQGSDMLGSHFSRFGVVWREQRGRCGQAGAREGVCSVTGER